MESLLTRSPPMISISSPHTLNPYDFLPRKSRGCKPSNAFMIYRTVYNKMLSKKGLPSKMTEVSRWASEAWKFERKELKDEYCEFAKKVSKIYRERAQALGIPRIRPIILPNQPKIPSKDLNLVNSPIHELPTAFNTEEFRPIQNSPTFYETNYPLRPDMPDIYLPNLPFDLFDRYCEEDNENVIAEEPNLPWQYTYDDDINMNMDFCTFYLEAEK